MICNGFARGILHTHGLFRKCSYGLFWSAGTINLCDHLIMRMCHIDTLLGLHLMRFLLINFPSHPTAYMRRETWSEAFIFTALFILPVITGLVQMWFLFIYLFYFILFFVLKEYNQLCSISVSMFLAPVLKIDFLGWDYFSLQVCRGQNALCFRLSQVHR